VQAAIDLAAHIVASEGIGLPEAIKDNFRLLRNAGIIGDSLTSRMESMSGFRNIAIHDYQAMSIDILKSILSKHLKDLEDFYTTVLIYFKFVSQ
jgi:uncharacterized protein YutE (UPF0331/DUF86 family)